jgi:hypothetical protein
MSTSDTTSKPIDPNQANSENPLPPENDGGLGDVLTGKTHIASDTRMVGRAIREGWGLTPKQRSTIAKRLMGIVEKTTVDVATANGPVSDDGKADTNSIRASQVLVTMNAQDQADDHLREKNSRLDAGLATEAVKMYGVDAPLNDV